jgi:serine phosphatase RsbU (regulator of sigma subunit)
LSAALFTSLLSQLIENAIEQFDNLCEIMAMTNRIIYSALPDTMFVTLFICIIEDNNLHYMNAGHPPPFHLSKKTGLITNLESKNTTIVGINPDLGCGINTVEFEDGDILLAMTDGANESLRFRDKPYDVFGGMLSNLAHEEAQEITDRIFTEITEEDTESLTDDIILFCLKKK